MRLGNRRPSTSTTFADAASGEEILQVASDEHGLLLMSFHLYDATGSLVADSEGLTHYPDGITVKCSRGEVLLEVPPDSSVGVSYRLYNSTGFLLTQSDGARTKIYSLLRMEGVGRGWVPPSK
jgi:hypothetical protein